MSHCDELRLARCRAVSSPAGCRRSLRLGLRRYYSTDEEAAQLAAALRVPLDNRLAKRLTTPSRLRRAAPCPVGWSEADPLILRGAPIPPRMTAVVLVLFV